MYDRSLAGAVAPEPVLDEPVASPAPSAVPLQPSRFPWRGLVVATTVAAIAVAAASLFTGPASPPAPDGILEPGSCVTIEPNADARETTCTGDGDITVRRVVPAGVPCPIGTRPHRDHQGQGTACLDFPDLR